MTLELIKNIARWSVKHIKSLLIAGLALMVFWMWDADETPIKTLEEGETAVVTVNNNRITTTTKEGTKTTYVPGEAEVRINRLGDVDVKVRKMGFCFKPGLASTIAPLRQIGLDVQWFYFDRFGLVFGVGAYPLAVNVYLAGSYQLPFKFTPNTQLFLGLNQDQKIVGGVRLRF